MRPRDEDIAYGIEMPEIYDGIIAWRLTDGSLINRWAGVPGYERRAARVDAWIASESGSTSTDTETGTPDAGTDLVLVV